MDYQTLNQALQQRAQDPRFINFIDGLQEEQSLSFAELHVRARQWLHCLQQHGLRPGDELIFFLRNNRAFIEAFWGCLLGGIVPVPVAVGISDEHRSKLFRICRCLQKPHLLIDARANALLQDYAAENALQEDYAAIAGQTIITEQIEFGAQGDEHVPQADDVAFIQFSSGSTREPKGVVLTHRNLLVTVTDLGNRAQYRDDEIALSWMPLTHDLGLIGFHLNMLVFGMTHHIMATDLFSRRPLAWLQKTSEKRANVLSSPNFGYKHYLKMHEARDDHQLDLSCVRIIMNGAEPISVSLCNEFQRVMGAYGLAQSAIYTCYGLAEAALAVSLPVPGSHFEYVSVDRNSLVIGQPVRYVDETDPNAVRFVIEGPPVERCAVRAGDADGRDLGENVIGEMQLKGPNVTSGYYNDSDANRDLFTADGYLRTGDLGFLRNGQLVITGRLKDIIFANGLNYYPHDLEAVALLCPQLELGKVAALGVRANDADHDEVLVCVVFRAGLEDFVPIARQVRQLINEHIGLEVAHVLPVQRIPKTTSGKIQRRFFADAYQGGEFVEVIKDLQALLQPQANAVAEQSEGTAALLLQLFREALPDKVLGAQDNFFEVGLSSLDLAAFQERINEHFPDVVDITDMFDHATLLALAAFIDSRQST